MPWFCLVLFCAAFAATVAATPWVIMLAHRLGAVDAPDGFRKIGHGATPRMGGLAIAVGLIFAFFLYAVYAPRFGAELWADLPMNHPATLAALALMLTIGVIDDRQGLSPAIKLLGQGAAAVLLFSAGFQIQHFFVFGVNVDLGVLALPITCFWFIGCMNVWNLIDGMDGLASGVGAIVCTTLMAAAAILGHLEVAYGAAILAGALGGFLMFNFHPAKVFLGDTGSLLLGTMLGMLAIRGSLKSGMTVAILIPVLSMGLPIVDTLLAILRRWVRRLPWSAPDRGHLHHRLIAFGLSTRQASLFLYSFTLLLCTSALASIALQSDSLALLFAVLGTLGLGAVFAARREERTSMLTDFRQRLTVRKLEQRVARIVWEGIQRLANCTTLDRLAAVAEETAGKLRCDHFRLRYQREGHVVLERRGAPPREHEERDLGPSRQRVQLRFALSDWPDEELLLEFQQNENEALPLAVCGPFLCRFNREMLDRVRQLYAEASADAGPAATRGAELIHSAA